MHIGFISGNATREAEVRYANDGKPSLTVSVAVSDRRRVDSEWQDDTKYYRVHLSGPRVTYLSERIQTGTQIFATGRLQLGTYETKAGETRLSLDLWATDIELGQRQASGTSAEAEPKEVTASNGRARTKQAESANLEDLPF